ncbi:MAG: hypothetical protein LBB84_02600 [Tannerellaceae bacterium]|jgi:hypothetical protein|nr:hypothetical protein [Tannerellaceae bacterium]
MQQDFEKEEFDFFNSRTPRNEKFWLRLGGQPDFTDQVVLEVGCGHAKKVVDVDIDTNRIAFARKYLALHEPQYAGVVEFYDMELEDYRRIFRDSGLRIVSFRVNVSRNLVLRFFSFIRFVFPFLREYFAHNIYAVLQKE